MKLALYKNTTYAHSSEFPSTVSYDADGNEDPHGEYARVSAVVDVEFPALTEEASIKLQLDALDNTEQTIRNEFQQKLNAITNRRSELQALTFTPAA
jgi:hypothetical protein